MINAVAIFKMAAMVIAAVILGRWFMAEVKAVRIKGEPAYKAYLSIPGIIIILAIILLPIMARIFL